MVQSCELQGKESASLMLTTLRLACWWIQLADCLVTQSFDDNSISTCLAILQIGVGADQQAGKLEAYRIDRAGLHGCKAYFHYFMNKPNKAMRDVALHLFDRHGHLKQHLYGTFGPETNPGGLIFMRTLALKRQYQGRGIVCQAIKQLLKQLNHPGIQASWNLAGISVPCAICNSSALNGGSSCDQTAILQ